MTTMSLSISSQGKPQTTVGHRGLKKVAARRTLDVQLDGVRKMPQFTAKTPSPPPYPPKEEVIDSDGEDLVDELQLRNLGSFLHCHDKHLSLHTNGRVNDLVQELDEPRRRPAQQGRRPPCQHTATAGTCRCTTAGMSTTSKNCTWSVGKALWVPVSAKQLECPPLRR